MAKDVLKVTLFCIVLCNVCYTSKTIPQESKLTVGRESKGSLCDQYHVASFNHTYEVTGDDYVISPPCGIYFIGLGEYNYTYGYEDVCYNILDVKVPCGINNTISIKEWKVNIDSNETHILLLVNETLPIRKATFSCDSVLAHSNNYFCASTHEPFILELSMDITTANKSVLPSVTFNADQQEGWLLDYEDRALQIRILDVKASILPIMDFLRYSVYMFNDDLVFTPIRISYVIKGGWVNLDSYICDCTDGTCSHCKHVGLKGDIEEGNKKADPDKNNIDVNNIITIVGGIVTSLFVPVILLLIRNFLKKRIKQPTKNRHPADGSDSIDARDDDDDSKNATDVDSDNDSSTNNLLSSPRPSIFSDDLSFHSATTSI